LDIILVKLSLNFAIAGSRSRHRPSINGIAYKKTEVAAVLHSKSLPTACDSCAVDDVPCECTHILTLTRDMVHQIVLLDLGSGRGFSHPVHIHGHSFYVVKMGYPEYNSTTGRQT